ncbi:hypothetical protein SRB5_00510 [Streptomyces sp. RB5]|uniref:Uncharacterized protein n=1 Tax=Streptomyces smaragdinus TaxID=2585196 RepID=A0A7K0C921_9ACTN|nr:hypothetical protein [Streptomyces smaragdinus]MQY09947.1 hypothetical protein [Streptomyces smaragdinus]
MRHSRYALALASTLALVAGATTTATPAAAADTVTLSGVAYNMVNGGRIPLARITIPETGASVTAGWNGAWSIRAPVGSDATIRVSALGFHTMYTQTFQNLSADIDGIYLQTPDVVVAAALQGLIAVYEGRDPFTDGCVVVSTVSDPRVVGMPYDDFWDFIPHGVAGATVTASPPLAKRYYFTEDVIPVPSILSPTPSCCRLAALSAEPVHTPALRQRWVSGPPAGQPSCAPDRGSWAAWNTLRR